jgi:DNA repair exonuclease SbcCD ATPase subunit
MRFNTLTIQNFLSYGPVQEVCLANQGLVGVFGANTDSSFDSNGSGKSAIIEAIVWCLWGGTVRGLKADEVVNAQVGHSCEVTLTIDDGDSQYKITRYRGKEDVKKKNDVLVELNGVDATQGIVSDTQAFINNVVGITFDTFSQSVLLTANTKSFCTLKDSEQKEVLEDILNIDMLRRAQAQAKKEISKAEALLSGHLGRLGPIADHIAGVESDIKTLNAKSDTWERESGLRSERIKLSIAETQASIDGAKEAAEKYVELSERVAELKGEASEIEEELEGRISSIGTVDEKVNRNMRKISKKKIEQDTVVNMTRASISRLSNLAGTVCETCAQSIDPDTADEQIQSLESLIDDANDTILNLVMLEGKLLAAGEAERAPHEAELGVLRDALRGLNITRDGLEVEEQNARSKASFLPSYEQRMKDLEDAIGSKESTANPYLELIESGKEDIKNRKKDAKLLKNKVKAAELELKGLRFWERGFGNKGLKSYILDNVVPFLNKRAQKYADIMSDGALTIRFSTQTRNKDGSLREKFNVSVVNANGADVYKGNSSGERRRSDVAIGWALADLAATRASKPIRFRGLDEPFENLDAEGIDAVFKLLQSAVTEYETILCITHNSGLKTRFTNELHVTKKHGSSTIQQ